MKTKPHSSRAAKIILAVIALIQISVPQHRSPNRQSLGETGSSSAADDVSALGQTVPAPPMFFEANRGQADDDVRFVGRGNGFALLLKQTEAVVALRPQAGSQGGTQKAGYEHSKQAHRVAMKLEGANPAPLVYGTEKQDGHVNYLMGRDESKWIRNAETYARVSYAAVYPGIDLTFRTTGRQLEYDFNLCAGADPRVIRMRFDGADKLELGSDGALVIHTPAGNIRHEQPVAFQDDNGQRMAVSAEFEQVAESEIGFKLGAYDATKPVVIDPTLVYSSYLGGGAADTCRALAVHPMDNVILLAGDSSSSDFLTKASPNNSDVFVGRLTKNGGQFSYTFFGGAGNDTVTGFAVDAMGNGYLCGSTESADFPLVHSFGSALAGPSDAFVALLNPEGNAFLYSSLVGGSGQEAGVSVAADGNGNAYITGRTTSQDFPTMGAIQPAYGGGDSDAFITKLSTDGATLVYSSYLGGTGTEDLLARSGINVDAAGNAYVVGQTQSVDFPTKNALRGTKTGAASTSDGFLAGINPSGSDFVFSTYLGGSDDDSAIAVALDQPGNIYVTGRTKSTGFTGSTSTRPATATTDAFVAKLNPAASAIIYLRFVGGDFGDESANAIAVNAAGVAVIAGSAGPGLPTVNPIQRIFKGGQSDAFVARLTASSDINFSTYLGGSADDVANGVGIDPDGHLFVAGFTDSVDFLTFSSLRGANSGGRDLFFARIDPDVSSDGPVLLQALISGKQLIINGQNFDNGAKLRINDEQTKTRNGDLDPSEVLIAKKGAKRIAPGQVVQLQVVNANGKKSNLIFISKPL